jgi:hypothetical protein
LAKAKSRKSPIKKVKIEMVMTIPSNGRTLVSCAESTTNAHSSKLARVAPHSRNASRSVIRWRVSIVAAMFDWRVSGSFGSRPCYYVHYLVNLGFERLKRGVIEGYSWFVCFDYRFASLVSNAWGSGHCEGVSSIFHSTTPCSHWK